MCQPHDFRDQLMTEPLQSNPCEFLPHLRHQDLACNRHISIQVAKGLSVDADIKAWMPHTCLMVSV